MCIGGLVCECVYVFEGLCLFLCLSLRACSWDNLRLFAFVFVNEFMYPNVYESLYMSLCACTFTSACACACAYLHPT